MPTVSFVTPEELLKRDQRIDRLEQFLTAYIESVDDEVDTATALQLTGIKSRTTLIEERDRPGTLLRYSKHGRSTAYSRASCIDYKLSRRLAQTEQPTTTLRISA